jgi:hypothetical protein
VGRPGTCLSSALSPSPVRTVPRSLAPFLFEHTPVRTGTASLPCGTIRTVLCFGPVRNHPNRVVLRSHAEPSEPGCDRQPAWRLTASAASRARAGSV